MTAGRHQIPSASIVGVDLARIRRVSPIDATRLEELNERLEHEDSSELDLIELCELLIKHREDAHAFNLLKCNVLSIGDACYRAMRRHFGFQAEAILDAGIVDFQDRFQVVLWSVPWLHVPGGLWTYLRYFFHSEPSSVVDHLADEVHRFLSAGCAIQIDFEGETVMADISFLDGEGPEQAYLLLRFCDQEWSMEELPGQTLIRQAPDQSMSRVGSSSGT